MDDSFMAGVSASIMYIISEAMELASDCARDCWRYGVVPLDTRLNLVNDVELRRPIFLFQGRLEN
jgi:hypothetical protein